jgi:hypothetical protein
MAVKARLAKEILEALEQEIQGTDIQPVVAAAQEQVAQLLSLRNQALVVLEKFPRLQVIPMVAAVAVDATAVDHPEAA